VNRPGAILFQKQLTVRKLVIFDRRDSMRLDKFLKVSRLIKRRSVANEACDAGRVMINDKPAKASATVKAGDVLTIQFGNKEVKAEILDVKETVKKEEASELFRYL
jgi:ribosomal 50S subunit-recycling heat shock protein